jgi:hypothetical protein
MKRDPAKLREWQDRSRRKAAANASKKRKPLNRVPKNRGRNRSGQPHDIITQAAIDAHRAFQDAARKQHVCARCDKAGPWHPHHVVYKQDLERENLPPDDPDNALRLCPDCHHGHHYGTPRQQLHMCRLKTQNIRYAFRVLGPNAGSYLRRRYRGSDPRLEQIELAQAA